MRMDVYMSVMLMLVSESMDCDVVSFFAAHCYTSAGGFFIAIIIIFL